MNAFVKKEIRLLLPNFGFACVLALAGVFFPDNPDNVFNSIIYALSGLACPAAAVMLALSSFGGEVSAGTFSNLLAQPISRLKIWETKIALLAAALVVVVALWLATFLISVFFHSGPSHGIGGWLDLLTLVSMTGVVVFSGGLWTVLLLRQVAAAFWFTLLVPGVLLMIVMALVSGESDAFITAISVSVLGLYSLAGFFFARRLFLRAQDLQWSGGTIVMPEMRGLARFKSAGGAVRTWRPRAALWRKEFMLHQSQFVMAFVLVVLHLGVLALPHFYDLSKSRDLKFILEIFWGLWLVMPMLVGAAAVAEERKLGTLGSQFCLPVKLRTQFAIKFRIAMLLSVLFGVVMPLLLEGTRILPNTHFGFNPLLAVNGMDFLMGSHNQTPTGQFFFLYCLFNLDPLLPLFTLLILTMAIGGISFYASTLTRNTLQALAPAVLGVVLTAFIIISINDPNSLGLHFPWRGWLIYFTGVPMFAITLVGLSYRNFKHLNPGGKVWLQNAFVFAAALAFVIVTTSAIYFRAWEKLTPFEPAHGAARLSLANQPVLNNQWGSISVRLADGKIWAVEQLSYNGAINPVALFLGNMRMMSLGNGHFYNGSNWVRVLVTYRNERVGIKTDGTLWVSEKPARFERLPGGGWKVTKAGDLVRFGSETNWNSVVQHGLEMLLVKNDGALWHWGGPTNWNFKKAWPGLKSFTPQRLGMETNWSEVFSLENQPCLRKTDGSVWTTWNNEPSSWPIVKVEPGFSIQRAAYLENGAWRSTTTIGMFKLGIRDSGTFRIRAEERLNQELRIYEWNAAKLQFGTDTNWLAVAGGGQKSVTLKNDGTLWLWNFYHDNSRGWNTERDERDMLAVKPVRLGTHADWIAITSAEGGIISLAADGSLWYWPLASASDFAADFGGSSFWDNRNNNYFVPLLDISRKPQLLGNIFDKAD